jgi:two-component system, sensor histidine kinase and response regulator
MAIDQEQALSLLSGDRELLKQLATIFVEDSEQLVADFIRAVDEQDAAKARIAAHSLKGLASTFFASEEVELFAKLETAAAAHDWTSLDRSGEVLNEAVKHLINDLQEQALVIEQ